MFMIGLQGQPSAPPGLLRPGAQRVAGQSRAPGPGQPPRFRLLRTENAVLLDQVSFHRSEVGL